MLWIDTYMARMLFFWIFIALGLSVWSQETGEIKSNTDKDTKFKQTEFLKEIDRIQQENANKTLPEIMNDNEKKQEALWEEMKKYPKKNIADIFDGFKEIKTLEVILVEFPGYELHSEIIDIESIGNRRKCTFLMTKKQDQIKLASSIGSDEYIIPPNDYTDENYREFIVIKTVDDRTLEVYINGISPEEILGNFRNIQYTSGLLKYDSTKTKAFFHKGIVQNLYKWAKKSSTFLTNADECRLDSFNSQN